MEINDSKMEINGSDDKFWIEGRIVVTEKEES